jgi:hypothetical protein
MKVIKTNQQKVLSRLTLFQDSSLSEETNIASQKNSPVFMKPACSQQILHKSVFIAKA